MSQARCEQLVEQYLRGGMTHAQEQEFFIQVAVDEDLRRTLKAYQIVESSIRKEREASTHGHHQIRSRVAEMYAASLAERTGVSSVSNIASIVSPGRATVSFRWITAAFVVTVAVVLYLTQSSEPSIVPNASVNYPAPTMQPAPAQPWDVSPRGAGIDSILPSVSQQQISTQTPLVETPQTRSTRADVPSPTIHPSSSAITRDTAANIHTQAVPPMLIDSVPRSVRTQDTLKFPVHIDWDRK